MACQICGGMTEAVLLKERNVSCGDYFDGRRNYNANLGEIELLECKECGFGCFVEMYAWTEERYRNEIYNEDYHLCDQPFREERPRKLANWLGSSLQACDLIDFGGGEGRLAELLTEKGFRARSYDPFYSKTDLLDDTAAVVTAFEVVEHVPNQRTLFRSLKKLCRSGGIIIFSTLLKHKHLTQDWWYASPRNGHVSFHTTDSLKLLMSEFSLASISLSQEMHVSASQAAALAPPSNWPPIPVNDIPKFVFSERWSRMIPIPAAFALHRWHS